MLVSAVVDPSAFNAEYFDEVYGPQAIYFLKGIRKNGLLIVDSEHRLRRSIIDEIQSIPIKYGQQIRLIIPELLKRGNKPNRFLACDVPPGDPLDVAYYLRTLTDADVLIVGIKSLEKLKAEGKDNSNVVVLSEYNVSKFEQKREEYEPPTGAIDELSREEVDSLIIRPIRFTKWLRFYDPYIGGDNTKHFLKGIRYILSLWKEHGFFPLQDRTGIEIFTRAPRTPGLDTQEQRQRIVQGLVEPLEQQFRLQVKVEIKVDEDRIFHARYLETQHAIIGVERGFDLFKGNNFHTNFFMLNFAAAPHLKRCRDLPNACRPISTCQE